MSTLLEIALGKRPDKTEKDLIADFCPDLFPSLNGLHDDVSESLCKCDACVTCWTREAKEQPNCRHNCFTCARFDGNFCSILAKVVPDMDGYVPKAARNEDCVHWVGGEA